MKRACCHRRGSKFGSQIYGRQVYCRRVPWAASLNYVCLEIVIILAFHCCPTCAGGWDLWKSENINNCARAITLKEADSLPLIPTGRSFTRTRFQRANCGFLPLEVTGRPGPTVYKEARSNYLEGLENTLEWEASLLGSVRTMRFSSVLLMTLQAWLITGIVERVRTTRRW